MMDASAVDIIQPSVAKIGCITEVINIPVVAEAMDVRLVPHCGIRTSISGLTTSGCRTGADSTIRAVVRRSGSEPLSRSCRSQGRECHRA